MSYPIVIGSDVLLPAHTPTYLSTRVWVFAASVTTTLLIISLSPSSSVAHSHAFVSSERIIKPMARAMDRNPVNWKRDMALSKRSPPYAQLNDTPVAGPSLPAIPIPLTNYASALALHLMPLVFICTSALCAFKYFFRRQITMNQKDVSVAIWPVTGPRRVRRKRTPPSSSEAISSDGEATASGGDSTVSDMNADAENDDEIPLKKVNRDDDSLLDGFVLLMEKEKPQEDDPDEQLIKKYEKMIFGDDEDDDYDELRAIGEDKPAKPKAAPKKKKGKDAPQRHRREAKVLVQPNTCAACGSLFQKTSPDTPGYLPPNVYERVFLPDRDAGWSLHDEVKAHIEEARAELGIQPKSQQATETPVIDDTVQEEPKAGDGQSTEGIEGNEDEQDIEFTDSKKRTICQRCYTMQHKLKDLKNELRSGWSDNDLLQPERFRKLLSPLRKKDCLIVMFVDLFDFHGSMLRELFDIVGFNPVFIVANKVDLLPQNVEMNRIRQWVWMECKKLNLKQLSIQDIHLVSCKSGEGISDLLGAIRDRAGKRPTYIVGAANVGKSSFINALVAGRDPNIRIRPGAMSAEPQIVTSSLLPGTTLDFLEIQMKGVTMFDTPGIVMPHQLTSILTLREMEAVIPSKQLRPTTIRVEPNQCVLLGAGLGQVEIIEGRAMNLTFFMAPKVTIHPCKPDRVPILIERHSGALLSPPYTVERANELLSNTHSHEFEVSAEGREKPAIWDITIGGLGWFSITGWGNCRVRVTVPRGIQVRRRLALLPYEGKNAQHFTGTAIKPLQRKVKRSGW